MKSSIAAFLILIPLAFSAGYQFGRPRPQPDVGFHDIRINRIQGFTNLIDPHHPEVRYEAARFDRPAEAYYFVRDEVMFDPVLPGAPPNVTLRQGAGSCLGKTALLCSLYRAMGIPADDVRVVIGEVFSEEGLVEHAWLDLEIDGICLQQDPTCLLGRFGFDDFRDTRFTDSFIRKESFCFNDQGFAVVSQLNRFRDRLKETLEMEHHP